RVVRTEHPVDLDQGLLPLRGGDHIRVRAGYAYRSTTSRPTLWAGDFDVELTPGAGGGGRPHFVRASRGRPAGWILSGYLLNQNGTRKKGEPTRLFLVSDLSGIRKLGDAPWQAKAAAQQKKLRDRPLPAARRGPAKAAPAVRRKLDELAATLPADDYAWRSVTSHMRPREREIDRQIEMLRDTIDRYVAEKHRFDAHTKYLLPMETRHGVDPDDFRRAREKIWDHSAEGIALAEQRTRLKRLEKNLADGPTPSTQHLFREAPPKAVGHRYEQDQQGTIIPPKELEEHLDSTMEAGRRLYAELERLLASDREWVDLNRKLEDGELSQDVIDQLWRQGGIEYQTRIRERQAAILKRVARRKELILQMLASVRGYGSAHHGNVEAVTQAELDSYNYGIRDKDARELPPHPDFADHIRTAEGYYPDDWITLSENHGPFVVASRRRAHYRNSVGLLATSDHDSQQWTNNAFPSSYEETNVHELAHRMEMAIPGLRALEFAYVRRRATRRGVVDRAKKLKTIFPNSGYDDHEWSYEDQWADAYSGKTYEIQRGHGVPNDADPVRHHWELFSTGVEDLFGGVPRFDRGVELQHFTLGVLALLARQRRT